MEDSYLVNFISGRTKRGSGHFHKALMRTEYALWLKEIKVDPNVKFLLEGKVITVFYSKSDLTFSGIKKLFEGLSEFCEEKGIQDIVLPLSPLVSRGADLEFLNMAVTSILSNGKLKVLAG